MCCNWAVVSAVALGFVRPQKKEMERTHLCFAHEKRKLQLIMQTNGGCLLCSSLLVITNWYSYHQFKCKGVFFFLQVLQVWRLVYSPEFATLPYPVNCPLLPAASYLHLTAICLHLVKMNANLDSYFFLSSGLLLLPNMLASFSIMNLGFERWKRNRAGVHPYMDTQPYLFLCLIVS